MKPSESRDGPNSTKGVDTGGTQSFDARLFVDWLDAATVHENLQQHKQRTYELAGTAPGRRILDVGCRDGEDTIAMARQVGSSGEVVGVESSEAMIREARRRARGLGLPVRFEVADGLTLPFADNSFDGCRADRLFHTLDDPEAVLAEMVRVARPGAWVVATDPDLGGAAVDLSGRASSSPFRDLLGARIANPNSGRRLPGMFRAAGLGEIRVWMALWPMDPQQPGASFPLAEALADMQDQELLTACGAAELLEELAARSTGLEDSATASAARAATPEGHAGRQARRLSAGGCFFIVAGRKAT